MNHVARSCPGDVPCAFWYRAQGRQLRNGAVVQRPKWATAECRTGKGGILECGCPLAFPVRHGGGQAQGDHAFHSLKVSGGGPGAPDHPRWPRHRGFLGCRMYSTTPPGCRANVHLPRRRAGLTSRGGGVRAFHAKGNVLRGGPRSSGRGGQPPNGRGRFFRRHSRQRATWPRAERGMLHAAF